MDIDPDNLKASLYQKFGIPPLNLPPKDIFQMLCAFWQHFALHKRQCDKTGQTIISVFDEKCPYPVWHREEWIKHGDPPQAEIDVSNDFFEQLWELFQQCPIAHNVGAGNENCEYTDDWWYGKNCYLCHSGADCEDCYYSYRILNVKDSQFCVFSFDSELCTDLINSTDCYASNYLLNSRQCRDSAFLFDCHNCSNCLFSWNLRNKKYCLFNKQLSKEEFERERNKFDFSSRTQYDQGKLTFYKLLREKVWWRNTYLEQCENCSGDILNKCKNCQNCYLFSESEDCVNSVRGGFNKDNLNVISSYKSELIYLSSLAQDQCYDIRFCYNVIQCKFLEYSAHCFNSKYCFGSCGLVNKQYCIFNKQYKEQEYHEKVNGIKDKLKQEGIYGQFFPLYFAACPYDESLAGFHWPLNREVQIKAGYRTKEFKETKHPDYSSPTEIPDNSSEASPDICQKIFWDEKYQRPFQISEHDLKFCQQNQVPLPNQYYIGRIKENYSFVFFNGELRETQCAETGQKIMTALPQELDSRILSLQAYLKKIG